MFVIDDVIISEEIFTESFHCHLEKCKGACCREGDYGAPLTDEELLILEKISKTVGPLLSEKSKAILENGKGFVYQKKQKVWATYCHEDGSCIYLEENTGSDILSCGIEKAYRKGEISFQKPISCHLYPIRITQNEISGFEAWNYDRWDICHAACQLGESKKVPVFRFVKDAIIRLKGEAFYDQLEETYLYSLGDSESNKNL